MFFMRRVAFDADCELNKVEHVSKLSSIKSNVLLFEVELYNTEHERFFIKSELYSAKRLFKA